MNERDEIIKQIEYLNRVASDLEIAHRSIMQAAIETRSEFVTNNDTRYPFKQLFLNKYSISDVDLPTFKFP